MKKSKKQGHIHLLEKIRSGQTLTARDMGELAKLEGRTEEGLCGISSE